MRTKLDARFNFAVKDVPVGVGENADAKRRRKFQAALDAWGQTYPKHYDTIIDWIDLYTRYHVEEHQMPVWMARDEATDDVARFVMQAWEMQ